MLNAAARTQSAILEMKSVLKRNFEEMMAKLRAGEEIPMLDRRVRYRYESSPDRAAARTSATN